VIESWYADLPLRVPWGGESVEERLDRKEVVLVQVDSAAGCKGWLAAIHREADGRGRLGAFELFPGVLTGRFAGFLRGDA